MPFWKPKRCFFSSWYHCSLPVQENIVYTYPCKHVSLCTYACGYVHVRQEWLIPKVYAFAISVGNWDGGLSEMTYQMSVRKTLAISQYPRGTIASREIEIVPPTWPLPVRFTAGHKMQTVFGAPDDVRTCHSKPASPLYFWNRLNRLPTR